ncbi:MAG: NAD(P)/FAD-dependent oxidoreductase [Oscillospiraceae bacterium]|nr:NAD(P)/FAD-dependent oxidoreductase [Oscillospiraceae bacterium]
MYDCIIIGGGAAGLMAAVTAADCGKRTLLLEKNDRIGRKLLITGKGRCNVTNCCTADEFMENIVNGGRFLYSSYSAFDCSDTMNFFEDLGVPLKVERGNRVFPVSDKAADIAAAFERAIKAPHRRELITLKTNLAADSIVTENGCIKGVMAGGSFLEAPSVLIAAGGCSYPKTGSDGFGYKLARKLGHTVTPLRPSLVPLTIKESCCGEMMGLSLKNATLSLIDEKSGKILFSELGEMLFTHFGVSGPLVLSASGHIREPKKNSYKLKIDLKPGLDEKALDNRIQRDFSENLNKSFSNSLSKLLPSKMIGVIVRQSGISPEKKVNQISRTERASLVRLIKGFTLTVADFRPIAEAIVTSGGVVTSEINPKTMQSKIISGLYFAGEVIDADAYTGGFNLQIAFSTGHAAGTAM